MNRRRYSNLMRSAAAVAAMFLLLGQTIAVAHFHATSTQRELSSSAASVGDSSCPICAAHLNSSASAPVVPTPNAPTIAEKVVPLALHPVPSSSFVKNCFGRAPPAAV